MRSEGTREMLSKNEAQRASLSPKRFFKLKVPRKSAPDLDMSSCPPLSPPPPLFPNPTHASSVPRRKLQMTSS